MAAHVPNSCWLMFKAWPIIGKNKQCNGIQYKNGAQMPQTSRYPLPSTPDPTAAMALPPQIAITGTDKIGSVTVHFQELTSYEPAYEQMSPLQK